VELLMQKVKVVEVVLVSAVVSRAISLEIVQKKELVV